MFESVAEALAYLGKHEISMVDLKIAGVFGQWLHITVPAKRFSQAHFEEGVGFDGSSGAGFRTVENGDVAALPDPATGFVDPFPGQTTLSFLCDAVSADDKRPLPGDPRSMARRAVQYMRGRKIADEALMAPEFEFYVLDAVRVHTDPYDTRVTIESSEAQPGGAVPVAARRRGYLKAPPAEHLHDVRSEIASTLEGMGVAVRYHHHEVGACGQCEIEIDRADLVTAADRAMLIKYVVRNVAARHGKVATFMPKPVYGEAGSGMHVHQKLDRAGKPLFFDAAPGRYANLSDTALRYVGGLLKHGRALTGLTNPSTNSFKRLVTGFEAPVNLFFSLANRSAAIRIPRYATSPEEKRIEYRPPDFTCNVYLALAAMLMAGVEGIESNLDLRDYCFGPFDVDIATAQDPAVRRIVPLPRSLCEALDALAEDQAFLLKGEVFSREFLQEWIDTRRADETEEIARRPHPYEYRLYFDA
ncbi:MAG: type I glutamate--ammonia ligase [Planctomycetes bacterium]|nr:type I glutamate--ammonia ligase [Planctomycetota bacterium]